MWALSSSLQLDSYGTVKGSASQATAQGHCLASSNYKGRGRLRTSETCQLRPFPRENCSLPFLANLVWQAEDKEALLRKQARQARFKAAQLADKARRLRALAQKGVNNVIEASDTEAPAAA